MKRPGYGSSVGFRIVPLFRYQLDHRERVMGLGSARIVTLAEARAQANEARKLLADGIDPLAARNAKRSAERAAELHRASFRQCRKLHPQQRPAMRAMPHDDCVTPHKQIGL